MPLSSSCNVRLALSEELLELINKSSCYPTAIQNRIDTYKSVLTPGMNYTDSRTKTRLTFDFEQNYDETVLVQEQSGGGTISFDLLCRLKFSHRYADLVSERVRRLGSNYVSFHVRNTDMQTDYQSLFDVISRSAGERRILICSDDAAVIGEAKEVFGPRRILVASQIPATRGAPLHARDTYSNPDQQKRAVTNSLVDLIALGSASRFFYTNVKAGYPSGYSRLAAYLCNNKDVIDTLLGKHEARPANGGTEGAVYIVPLRDRLRKMVPKHIRKILR